MKRYLTKLMFSIQIENSNGLAEFDEQIRVIEARNAEDAFYKARRIGKNEEETFVNQANQRVSWKFIDVPEVYSLEEMSDGQQLYSNTHKTHDGTSFVHYVRQKSMEIQVKNLNFA